MPANPNKLSQFWQELKRRKVIKVIAMYAGAAYVLIELANNVVEPLNLPDWTPRLVIIIALVGFPIMLVLSWIFDITPKGLSKTESLEELKELETPHSPVKRRVKVSDVIISVLVIVVGIFAYLHFFGTTRLNAMTFPVTVVNEFGERETRRVFKEDYITRLALFPFVNETGDTINEWLKFGIPLAIEEDLLQFSYIYLNTDYTATHHQEQLNYAKTNNHTHFLTGLINTANSVYEINSRLYQTANGALVEERFYTGDDFFSLIDSMSHQARIDLGISDVVLTSTPDLSISEVLTENLEAFMAYIEGGIYHGEYDSDRSCLSSSPAISLDSTFAYALYQNAYCNFHYQTSKISALMAINQAMRHRNRMSEYRELDIRKTYFMILGESEKAVGLTDFQLNLRPIDINLLSDLIQICQTNLLAEKYEIAALRLNELIPEHSPYQLILADSYILSGKLDKGLGVLVKLLKNDQKNTAALLKMGEIYLQLNDLEAAEEVYTQIMLMVPEEEKYLSKMLDHIAYMRSKENSKAVIGTFAGIYRFEMSEQCLLLSSRENHLLIKAENQPPIYIYPVSDSGYVTIIRSPGGIQGFTITFMRNEKEKVVRLIIEQSNVTHPLEAWKEDSLIVGAIDLLENGNLNEALTAFRGSYDQHPEHYYLANYIQHLEFVQSPEYESLESVFSNYVGEYDNLRLYKEGARFYQTDNLGFIFQLLPMTEDRFMIPSKYNTQIHMIHEGERVIGLKEELRDGSETFHSRISVKALAR